MDATFIKRAHRQLFRDLAVRRGVAFILLDCAADPDTQRARVTAGQQRRDDAAEADVEMCSTQLQPDEPPSADENPPRTSDDADLERLKMAIAAAREGLPLA